MTGLISTLMAWDLTSFLTNSTNQLKAWGGLFIILLGVAMIVVGIYQLAKGLIAHGKTQVNWFVVVALIIAGGALTAGGWTLVSGIASGGKKTIEDLGNSSGRTSTIILSNLMRFLW